MRILHTSDWHLGKYLENRSRLEEQHEFVAELLEICEREKIDLIIIAGDIYDSINPPAAAEQLFYKSMKALSLGGKRPIFIIAGNHDSPERLVAANPLSLELGIIVVGNIKTVIPRGEYEHYKIINSGEGFVEIELNGENVVITAMPYPSDKRLNEILGENSTEKEMQKDYSEKVGEIFKKLSENYRKDTINIATGHFYVIGGETSKSERDISLGGAYAVEAKELPLAQYIAMGHLHRPQKISGKCNNAYYSGSPIQYSKSEANFAKCVYVADIEPEKEAVVEKIYLRNYKPLVVWKCESIEDALEKCRQNKDDKSWIFIEVKTERPLYQWEIKEMRANLKDIIEIYPIIKGEDKVEMEDLEEKSFAEEFCDFYLYTRKMTPSKETLDLYLEICGEGYVD